MEHGNIENYFKSIDLQDVEPFTQIILNNKTRRVYKVYWDENDKYFEEITNSIFVVSSFTLYNEKQKANNLSKIKELAKYNCDILSRCHRDLFYDKINKDSIIKRTAIVQFFIDEWF